MVFGYLSLAAFVALIGFFVINAINGEPGDNAKSACTEWGGKLTGVAGTDGRRDDQVRCNRGDVSVTFADDGSESDSDLGRTRERCVDRESEERDESTSGRVERSRGKNDTRSSFQWNEYEYRCDETSTRLTKAQLKTNRYRRLLRDARFALPVNPSQALRYAERAVAVRSTATSRSVLRSANRAATRAASAPPLPSYSSGVSSGVPSRSSIKRLRRLIP